MDLISIYRGALVKGFVKISLYFNKFANNFEPHDRFLKKIKTLEINRPLCDLLVSRLLIYCMVIKEGLQFANFLSQVSSLQVGASHY